MSTAMEKMIKELVEKLNTASLAYYNGEEIMSNKEYDEFYDQLNALEQESGIILPDSPTQRVGAKETSELRKVKHEFPALSLDKTKDVDLIVNKFAEGEDKYAEENAEGSVLMWKCDGSTVIATYENGELKLLATRGQDGEIGSDITHNARFIHGLPMKLNYDEKVIVRGEAMMSYTEFERVNAELPDEDKYKNPRNLANATVSLPMAEENKELRGRRIDFFGFKLVEGPKEKDVMSDSFNWMSSMGFQVVPYAVASAKDTLRSEIERFSSNEEVTAFGYPVDGLVIALNNCKTAATLPGTGHHPNIMCGYALKWEDETVETVLRDIEWSASRTGLLNPVAVFDAVELEGTTVTRASLHNVSYILDRNLQVGDSITVYKANKIIPQVDKNLSYSKHPLIEKLEPVCPVCGSKAGFKSMTNQKSVSAVCENPYCSAKKIGSFVHFCDREGMNIVGLSEEKLAFLVNAGYINEISDILALPYHGNEGGVTSLDGTRLLESETGWGFDSVNNLVNAIYKACKEVEFIPFLKSLGIPGVGKGQGKLLKPVVNNYALEHDCASLFEAFLLMGAVNYDFSSIDGIGPVLNSNIHNWIVENEICAYINYINGDVDADNDPLEIEKILRHISFKKEIVSESSNASSLSGKVFVITGSLNHYPNRDALVSVIEAAGGKASGSVSAKTSYLINNDISSTSGKNKKAKELNVPIITEEDFMAMIEL